MLSPCLNLHEVCSLVLAARAVRVRAVYVLPGRGAAEHVLHLLELGVGAAGDAARDVVDVGARGAREPEAVLSLLAL